MFVVYALNHITNTLIVCTYNHFCDHSILNQTIIFIFDEIVKLSPIILTHSFFKWKFQPQMKNQRVWSSMSIVADLTIWWFLSNSMHVLSAPPSCHSGFLQIPNGKKSEHFGIPKTNHSSPLTHQQILHQMLR